MMFGALLLKVTIFLTVSAEGRNRHSSGIAGTKQQELAKTKTLAILMRTGGLKSSSRIESIRKTWANDLEDGALALLQPDSECKSIYGDNHDKGLTCLEAKHHLHFMNRTDFDWLLVVDDDVYVFADRLRATLRQMDPYKAEVYGMPFCGDCGGDGRKGFCGGGGYVLSRQSLLKMASAREAPVSRQQGEAFMRRMLAEPNAEWCDVRFGCVAQEMGLELVGVKGLYINGVLDAEGKLHDPEEERKVVALRSQIPPLVFHKVRDHAHMNRIHEESLLEEQQAKGKTTAYTRGGMFNWAFF